MRCLLRPDCLDNSDIADILTVSSAHIGPLDFHPVFRIRQILSSVEDEKGPLDLLSGGQLGSAAHCEVLVQALVERNYLVKSIGGCVYLRRLARGSGTGIATPLFIEFGA